MSHRAQGPFGFSIALMLALVAGTLTSFVHAAPAPDQNKPMQKKEPMTGGMKKDGMMKEDVSKAARKWDEKMDEIMKKENKK
jgi:Spy/CpxP family protein refolding chaperone